MPHPAVLVFLPIVTLAVAQCPPNNAQNASSGDCIECGVWQYPESDVCVNYASHADKIAADLGTPLDSGNTAWLMVSTAMVMLMTPALALFYGGLSGADQVLSTMAMSIISMCVITISWILWGYSFSFGPGNGRFGMGQWAALSNVAEAPSAVYGAAIPHVLFVAFQCMFAQITPALISGAVVGRMTFLSYCIYIFVWSLVIYNPLAQWVWGLTLDEEGGIVPLGWLLELGSIDFAGGVVIHIASGFAGLASSIVVGPRTKRDAPYDAPMVMLGASLLWFGWFGFNAGSAGAANGVAAIAFLNTHIAPCACVITWLLIETAHKKKQTLIGASTAIVVGLVSITPGCGYVTPMAAIAFGVVPAFFCYAATEIKVHYLEHRMDDALDSFACHGVGGMVGTILAGLFATKEINGIDGAFYGRPILLWYQIAALLVSASFSFFGSMGILLVLKYTIGVRVSEEEESNPDRRHSVSSDGEKSRSPRHSFIQNNSVTLDEDKAKETEGEL